MNQKSNITIKAVSCMLEGYLYSAAYLLDTYRQGQGYLLAERGSHNIFREVTNSFKAGSCKVAQHLYQGDRSFRLFGLCGISPRVLHIHRNY